MADNRTVTNTKTSFENNSNPDIVVAADEIASAVYQRFKLTLGADGVNDGDISAANPMPISGSISASLASAATASEGIVSVDSTAGGTAILASNASRKGGEVRVSINASQSVRIARGATADATARLYAPGDVLSLADGACKYTGAVTAFVASGTADVEYTEL